MIKPLKKISLSSYRIEKKIEI